MPKAKDALDVGGEIGDLLTAWCACPQGAHQGKGTLEKVAEAVMYGLRRYTGEADESVLRGLFVKVKRMAGEGIGGI